MFLGRGEARFAEMSGVLDTAVGYEGGTLDHPTYKEVCTDRTGHAEVVQVTFDPSRLAYETLLDAFFALHDPTQLNRQGPDWGTQYRSVVFAESDEQAAQARRKIAELNASGTFRKPIATIVESGKDLLEGRRVPPALPREARHDLLPHLAHAHRTRTARPVPSYARTVAKAQERLPATMGQFRREAYGVTQHRLPPGNPPIRNADTPPRR